MSRYIKINTKRLRAAIAVRRLTYKEIGERLGFHGTAVYRWAAGIARPTADVVEHLEQILGLHMGSLTDENYWSNWCLEYDFKYETGRKCPWCHKYLIREPVINVDGSKSKDKMVEYCGACDEGYDRIISKDGATVWEKKAREST